MRLAATLCLALLLVLSGSAQALESYATAPLTIDTKGSARHFTVELALTPAQQQQGLMYRSAMAPDAGMLFVFPETQTATFWMKNTLIPLDMLFIAKDGKVADLHERAVPLSLENIVSKLPVKAVLELNGGTVARLGIAIGDTVHAAAFGNAE
jgi:uncharacterized protein